MSDLQFEMISETIAPVSSLETTIRSFIEAYHVEPLKTGTFSTLYSGEGNLVKIAKSPAENDSLAREAEVLDRKAFEALGNFVPKLDGSFLLSGLRVNTMKAPSGLVSLSDIRRAYPSGLDPRDAAWIFRRVIAQARAAQMVGVVHTAIVPDHVLVDPVSHDPLHIGWAHSLDLSVRDRKISIVLDRWRAWYPPEVFSKQIAESWIDVYMSAKTMIWLLGGDVNTNAVPSSVPNEVALFLLQCLEKRFTAQRALTEFTSIVRKLWGKGYRKLEMP